MIIANCEFEFLMLMAAKTIHCNFMTAVNELSVGFFGGCYGFFLIILFYVTWHEKAGSTWLPINLVGVQWRLFSTQMLSEDSAFKNCVVSATSNKSSWGRRPNHFHSALRNGNRRVR